MIVRIATEGQYELEGADAEQVDKLDHEAIAAVEQGDEQRFRSVFDGLLEVVRSKGTPVGEDHLGGSDLILPPPDVSLADARSGFSGDGLIPD